ncbi:MAG: hypothetical protein OXQ94_15705 [Gemmatimonadota bacterium]|nr:hypothetical protein [Gemmatimonadota bacterium]MDE2873123.1 hypothetical protein [Gemmatimonadota bacterium]
MKTRSLALVVGLPLIGCADHPAAPWMEPGVAAPIASQDTETATANEAVDVILPVDGPGGGSATAWADSAPPPPSIRSWSYTNRFWETDDGDTVWSHETWVYLWPYKDENGNPWRITVREQQVDAFLEGITVLKDVVGTYTDVNGVERTTRAHRDGGWTFALPDSFPPTDRREVFDLVCDADFDGFPAHRKPASDIEITVSWVVQYAVRDSGSPRRVRPDHRKGSLSVTCPLAPS